MVKQHLGATSFNFLRGWWLKKDILSTLGRLCYALPEELFGSSIWEYDFRHEARRCFVFDNHVKNESVDR